MDINITAKIIESVRTAVEMKAETMIQYVDEAFDANLADDANDKTASITVPVKLTIKRNGRTGYSFHTRVQVKKIETELGECTTTFAPDQPDLIPASSGSESYDPERPDEE